MQAQDFQYRCDVSCLAVHWGSSWCPLEPFGKSIFKWNTLRDWISLTNLISINWCKWDVNINEHFLSDYVFKPAESIDNAEIFSVPEDNSSPKITFSAAL